MSAGTDHGESAGPGLDTRKGADLREVVAISFAILFLSCVGALIGALYTLFSLK